jgi:hypothetical protein
MERIKEWVSMCLRKKRLREEWADAIIKRADIPLRKYYCPHCFAWHITKQNETINKEEK